MRLAQVVRGDEPSPDNPRAEVIRCLAAVWPHLLAASNAIDGPDPGQAARHLREAAAELLASSDRIA